MTGVDTDLATLRGRGCAYHGIRVAGCKACDALAVALARVEAELSRLQQALREIDRHLTSTGGSLSPRHADHWRAREAAREALAGPDTPAEEEA